VVVLEWHALVLRWVALNVYIITSLSSKKTIAQYSQISNFDTLIAYQWPYLVGSHVRRELDHARLPERSGEHVARPRAITIRVWHISRYLSESTPPRRAR
jgi:hypothetical protein